MTLGQPLLSVPQLLLGPSPLTCLLSEPHNPTKPTGVQDLVLAWSSGCSTHAGESPMLSGDLEDTVAPVHKVRGSSRDPKA